MFFKKKNDPNKELKKKNKNKFNPSVFAILFSLLFIVIIISWIVYWATGSDPQGQFHPAGILELFTAPIKGFISSAELIIFLFMMSAFIKIVNTSKALDAGIGLVFLKLKGKESLLIVILFIIFVLCGTTFGMCEATIPFYFLLIPILLASGFDSLTAFIVITYGAGVGVLCSTINPVLIDNAFNAANTGISALYTDVPADQLLSSTTGILWRVVSLIVISAWVLGYMIFYTKRIKTNPAKSIVYDIREKQMETFSFDASSIPPLTKKRKIVVICFVLTFVLLVVGAIPWDSITHLNGFELLGQTLAQYFPYIAGQTYDPVTHQIVSNIDKIGTWSIFEMAFLFFIASFIVALVTWEGEKKYGNLVIQGASEFVGVAMIVVIANGFSILLSETGIQSVLISAIKVAAGSMPSSVFAIVLFFLFFIISIFIPSMSGFARTVYPTVGPALSNGLASVNGAGMTVSGSILGFSMANGLVNLCMPTSGPFVICLQICEIPMSRFYKKVWVLFGGIAVLCIMLLIIGTFIPGETIF